MMDIFYDNSFSEFSSKKLALNLQSSHLGSRKFGYPDGHSMLFSFTCDCLFLKYESLCYHNFFSFNIVHLSTCNLKNHIKIPGVRRPGAITLAPPTTNLIPPLSTCILGITSDPNFQEGSNSYIYERISKKEQVFCLLCSIRAVLHRR